MNIPMLDLGRLHAPLVAELTQVFSETLRSSRFIQGPDVHRISSALSPRPVEITSVVHH